MIPGSTVVVLGRAPEKMREAAAVLEADDFAVIGVFSETEALRAIAAQGAVIIDAFIGHADPADHFRSVVLPQLVAARAARTDDHR
jgi:hypothetical protein